MDKIRGFYISPRLMFSITFFSVMHFHNHLCISISPKILKEIFAKYLIIDEHVLPEEIQPIGRIQPFNKITVTFEPTCFFLLFRISEACTK